MVDGGAGMAIHQGTSRAKTVKLRSVAATMRVMMHAMRLWRHSSGTWPRIKVLGRSGGSCTAAGDTPGIIVL
jgi:hypothetical protein